MNKKTIHDLESLTDEELFPVRLCDLPLNIEDTWLKECIRELYSELDEKKIKFKPECYLADEWLCPDQEPVIGIPFYLAHPRLKKLEKKMMLEAEGDGRNACMKLLRHEAGHAINYAYMLYRRRKWRDLFGPFSLDYPDKYKYKPYSRRYVIHLEEWYAQYHPDEDFAETFAVWLSPGSDWENRYQKWQALGKLKYVDSLMKELSEKLPLKPRGKRYWDIKNMKTRLKTYYSRKKKLFAENYSDFHDFFLNKAFKKSDGAPADNKLYKTLKKHSREIIDTVSVCTGEKKYRINGLFRKIVKRSREAGLQFDCDEKSAVLKISVYMTAQIMNFMYTGRFKRKR